MTNKDDVLKMFGRMTGDKKYDDCGYHCVSCGYELSQITVKTAISANKKLFWCEHAGCPRFGTVTVVAKKKGKYGKDH